MKREAISPIAATLGIIAIVVIAAVSVSYFVLGNETKTVNVTEKFVKVKITSIEYVKSTNTTQIGFTPPITDAFWPMFQLSMNGRQDFDILSVGQTITIHYRLNDNGLTVTVIDISFAVST